MKWLAVAVCLLTTTSSPTFAKDRQQPFKPVTGAFFALSVRDMAPAVEWYEDKLGLSVTFQLSNPEVTVLEGGGLMVELIRDPAAQPGPVRPELMHGVFKAGFFVKDLDATVAELRTRGVTIAFGPFPRQGNQRANVVILDHEGNLIQIFGD